MRKLIIGENDLRSQYPEIAKEWHPIKNANLQPCDVFAMSGKTVWWLGKCGHEWDMAINSRTNQKQNCPYCSGRRVGIGINDLQTKFPNIAKEWHPTKNGQLYPYSVTAFSSKRVWWQCEKGHEWQSVISSRTSGERNCGCPYCSGHRVVKGKNDFASNFPEFAKEWDYTKNENIEPSDITVKSSRMVWWICESGHSWKCRVHERTIKNRTCPYCQSIVTTHPDIASEWHPTKNGNFKPENVTFGSGKKIWWKGKCGHEWKSQVYDRVSKNTECPYCSGRKTLSGFNDIASSQYLKTIWHPSKNNELDPKIIYIKTHKKIWWQCNYGHEWCATAITSSGKETSCPYCKDTNKIYKGFKTKIHARTDKKIIYNASCTITDCNYHGLLTPEEMEEHYETFHKNENQSIKQQSSVDKRLSISFPDIATEWHPTKNGVLTPNDFNKSSNKKAWWLGKCGHEWEARICSRTGQNQGCPYCSNRKNLKGYNDLETKFPKIASEWHPIKNGSLKPCDCMYGSHEKVWWQCENGHEWKAEIRSRTKNNTGCIICVGRKALAGYNDLGTLYPELVKEWHPTKNKDLNPSNVTFGSEKKIWWIGKCGHEWIARIADRTGKESGCPYCSTNRLLVGKNDLLSSYPDIAAEWHPTKNYPVTPDAVTQMADMKVWWICKNGHEYQSRIAGRTAQNLGCPYCSNKRVLKGYNDLNTCYPDIAKSWHPYKNGNITPVDVTRGSSKHIWWQCERGHEWNTTVETRRAHGCPYCSSSNKLYAGFKTKFLCFSDSKAFYKAKCITCGLEEALTPQEMLDHSIIHEKEKYEKL